MLPSPLSASVIWKTITEDGHVSGRKCAVAIIFHAIFVLWSLQNDSKHNNRKPSLERAKLILLDRLKGMVASVPSLNSNLPNPDVFSFGVLLLEIVSGQRNNTFYQTDRGGDILSYVWRAWNNGTVLEVIDPTISEHCPRSEAMRSIHIGLLCVQENATARPLMSSVVVMLNSFSITLPAPSAPAFFVSSVMEPSFQRSDSSQGSHLDSSQRKSSRMSQNDASISELEPR
ncbi:putative receptor-like protein kinase [Cinnamomum micranthum f. kanehirae]|uniref:Putative receptor-like protein kinase n=1 Tax=Cinnamomum micranthum f. kanehirae TaxID=337451 RepID=A0A443PJF5_9MAGN|nr:putative receptor-like protein kinase [Cinnamomum micranthum f. kanehirae]